jgi:diguanylate cyclase (GGDEF)-like protein/PAS domain S-box-containing protein
MTNQRTAGIFVESDRTSAVIGASLRSLGFLPLTLRDHEQSGSDHSANQVTICELIIADEARADAVRSTIPHDLIENSRLSPALIVLRDAGDPEDPVTDLNFDGIIQLPFTSEEVTRRLRDIVQAHHSLKRRCLPWLDELSLLQGVMRSVTNGITIADAALPDLPLIYINPAFEKMTGYTFDEVRGRNCRFLQAQERQQPGLTAIRDAIREQRDTMTVLRNYRKDGTPFWNELYFSPLRDSCGRLTHFVGIQSDVTLRVEIEQRLSFLAHHDSLTGLTNRELLFERLRQAVLRSSRHNTSVALLFFDLDNFKHVNDFFGHDVGDVLLRIVAERLQGQVRNCDTVTRLGGDEFVILVPDLEDTREIPGLIHRLLEQITRTIVIREKAFRCAASVGWSLYPRDGADPEGLLKAADFAMYTDKYKKRQAKEERQLPDAN